MTHRERRSRSVLTGTTWVIVAIVLLGVLAFLFSRPVPQTTGDARPARERADDLCPASTLVARTEAALEPGGPSDRLLDLRAASEGLRRASGRGVEETRSFEAVLDAWSDVADGTGWEQPHPRERAAVLAAASALVPHVDEWCER